MSENIKIGVFDSGIGGMSVLKELIKYNKGDFVYIGDNKNAPYGNKTNSELKERIEYLLTFLKDKEVHYYINACNSLSTLDIENILNKLNIDKNKYLDMVSSVNNNILDVCDKGKNILIYATKATIDSKVYQERLHINYNISTLASINLAFAIENRDRELIDNEIELLIESIIENQVDYLLLACTHYPLIIENIKIALEKNNILDIEIIDPAQFIALDFRNKISDSCKNNNIQIFMTKDVVNMDVLDQILINNKYKLEVVNIVL